MRCSTTFCVWVLVIGVARSGRAQVAVLDGTNLVQTTSTAISTAHMLENAIQQVQLMQQTLKSVDPTSVSSLQNLISEGQLSYQVLRGDMNALGFGLGDVNSGFDRLFPKDKTSWGKVRYSDYDSYYTGWNSEITGSAKLAERAQSSVLLIEGNNRAIAQILGQSASATGEVRQLQLMNQQLALIHARLGDLIQNIAAMGRMTSNMAASAAGEKLLLREAKLRRRDGYTNRGQPARTLNRLP
jgi:P-type conjugative transfer protein TrbJ